MSSLINNNPSNTGSPIPLITAPPKLRIRYPAALPQDPPSDECSSQAAQSASQAIQQATQQASQSIQQAQQSASQAAQQASQSASQAAQQASQSASQAIQQASNQASQSIAAASRSVSSAIASANSAIASAQSSADQAVSRANGSMMSAQASATSAQADASRAILQAGAAVAAATGSAAAAGSSFLQAAAAATRSASAIGAAAASQVAQANQQVEASQVAAVTATQAALAIVGSIIASTLITILVYFLVIRHKKKAKRRKSREYQSSPGAADRYFGDGKYPSQTTTTTGGYGSEYEKFSSSKEANPSQSMPRKPGPAKMNDLGLKTTTVKWNPSKPPKAPTLGSWLKVQDGVSPFGPIKLPGDSRTPSPSEGTSKPRLQNIEKPKTPLTGGSGTASDSTTSAALNPRILSFMGKKSTAVVEPSNGPKAIAEPKSPPTPVISPDIPVTKIIITDTKYRESQASVWTDDVPDTGNSPMLQSPPRSRKATSKQLGLTPGSRMSLPPPNNPIRNTAEWLAARQEQREPNATRTNLAGRGSWVPPRANRPTTGLPGNPRSGLPARPGSSRPIRSMEVEVGYAGGLNKFLPDGRVSTLSGMESIESRSSRNTPGVGKAM